MLSTKNEDQLSQAVVQAEKNYTIQINDLLKIDVYTNRGERIIDPDLKLAETIPNQNQLRIAEPEYLVDINGIAKVPMLGEIKIEGLTIRGTEQLLQKEYQKYYSEPFVRVALSTKRVVVLGISGGTVVPLVHENMKLTEILALSGSVTEKANVKNIRIVRGDQFLVADLSHFGSFKTSNMIMVPGDIVYVEPIRKPLVETTRDIGPLLSTVISIATLILVITR